MSDDDERLAAAVATLREVRARFEQAWVEHEQASGHEKAETYGPVGYWEGELAAARAAWRALAGPDAPEPR